MKNSIYTTQELKWFQIMINAGWRPKRVEHAILSGIFFKWTNTETGTVLDERRYYGGIDVLSFHQKQMTAPNSQNPYHKFTPNSAPLFRPM